MVSSAIDCDFLNCVDSIHENCDGVPYPFAQSELATMSSWDQENFLSNVQIKIEPDQELPNEDDASDAGLPPSSSSSKSKVLPAENDSQAESGTTTVARKIDTTADDVRKRPFELPTPSRALPSFDSPEFLAKEGLPHKPGVVEGPAVSGETMFLSNKNLEADDILNSLDSELGTTHPLAALYGDGRIDAITPKEGLPHGIKLEEDPSANGNSLLLNNKNLEANEALDSSDSEPGTFHPFAELSDDVRVGTIRLMETLAESPSASLAGEVADRSFRRYHHDDGDGAPLAGFPDQVMSKATSDGPLNPHGEFCLGF